MVLPLDLQYALSQCYVNFSSRLSLLKKLNSALVKSANEMDTKNKGTAEEMSKITKTFEAFAKGGKIDNNSFFMALRDTIDSFLLPEFIVTFIREMSLIFLVTEFEAFLGLCLDAVFEYKPEAMMNRQRSLTFEEILSFSSMENLRSALANQEIDSIINEGDIEKLNQRLSNQYKLLDFSSSPDWNEFKECFYRRNLIIHSGGKINDRYREKTGYKGEDGVLTVEEKFLDEAISRFDKYSLVVVGSFARLIIVKEGTKAEVPVTKSL